MFHRIQTSTQTLFGSNKFVRVIIQMSIEHITNCDIDVQCALCNSDNGSQCRMHTSFCSKIQGIVAKRGKTNICMPFSIC